jgi:hypothetical protein
LALFALGAAALAAPACNVFEWNFYFVGPASTSTTSTSGTTGTGGTGGAPLCMPGATQPCYDGPAGTEGVGLCQAGTQTCAADGASWGPCAGEVLPQAEDCATPFDDDCDGKAPSCTGTLRWAKRFGDGKDQRGLHVATDAASNVVVSGYVEGSVDFGGGLLTSAGGADVSLAKFDASGNLLWGKLFGDAGDQYGSSVAVDASGNVVMVGRFSETIDFGGGPLTSAGGTDIFVAKFDPQGSLLWSKGFGDPADQYGASVAVDSSGGVVIAGWFSGSVDFGLGPLSSATASDGFLAKLDASGNAVWSKSFPSTLAYGVAVDATGSVIVAGQITSAVDFGLGPVAFGGGADAFVAKFDGAGAPLWSEAFGDAGSQIALGVAVDGSQNVLVTGEFAQGINFGGTASTSLQSAGGYDVFVAKLDPLGHHVWSKRFGLGADQQGLAIAADASNSVVLTGAFSGSIDFGGNVLTSLGGTDIFLAKLHGTGDHIWSARFGDASDVQIGLGIATDASGDVVCAGYMKGSADFGGGVLTSAGATDMFVASFGP